MKYQGKIEQWNDEKGFGFVQPNGGGERLFVHIKAFKKRTRRPQNGDLIVYQGARDKQGRAQAVDICFAADHKRRAKKRPGQARTLGNLTVAAVCLFIVAAILLGKLPLWFVPLYLLLSLITFIAYGRDKAKAQNNQWRTPESTLQVLALFGGWPGAFMAQNKFRHKSKKGSFLFVFWLCVLVNLVAVAWLCGSDGQVLLAQISASLF
ncbi:DUF1294 domain-containing protein [Pseudoalteromonas sp. BDTF-M6]|uniref:DUF1294 domain-containing protein n=1 Tax=Pseudoalteromonas sp. BDTF-M6 TaxID=2796132 RepID=UPI001BAFAC39|nr:DUF1294 domain-containing protein [Pseudoalteromonas sp. BDTF-M6]MBS3797625.1 DUF1294 domain-containing protein [Pseudoalteromonas sp. BDTF-M6]